MVRTVVKNVTIHGSKMHVPGQKATFNYLGGKYSMLPWLLPLLPQTDHFVDVCGGSGVVLINRKPSKIETFNDINHRVINFFKVLRDMPDELVRLLQLTPHSREEYEDSWHKKEDAPIEQARKFFIRTQQSIWAAGGQAQAKGWAASIKESRVSISEKTHKWLMAVENLDYIANRLKTVQIECRDFKWILKHYNTPATLFYVDSPYDKTLRSDTKYEFEFANQDFHDLAHYAKKVKGKIAISGYRTDFMEEIFKDFYFTAGPKRKNNRSVKEAFEGLWTNYKI